uniref:Uncharacterized protein n=1 Tax=viral metagenome TaxID=1070528 RepID=A0A6C0ADZ7_9ZZZZ
MYLIIKNVKSLEKIYLFIKKSKYFTKKCI